MPCRAGDVDSFMAELEHPLKAGVEQLRAAILASSDGISEQVKWNAPSFVYAGVDRVTFRLQPGNGLQLVVHRGVAVRDDAAEFRFEDDSGLLQWVAGDRAVITFGNLDDVARR
jgi:hypothetical protein